ncbi:unnamed protein product [Pylaiella littoralis]
MIFVNHRTASVVAILGRLKAAITTCNAREELISAEIHGLVTDMRAFMACVQGAKGGNAAGLAAPAEAPAAPVAYPRNSIAALLERSWVEGYFYEEFVAGARETNDTDSVFYASELVSRTRTWYHESGTLGEGAFGTVTKVDVHTTGESFAVKAVKGDGTSNPGFEISRNALLVEMLICTRVAPHPNVLQAVAVDDRVPTDTKIFYELAKGDFTSCAWGDTADSVGTIMRYLGEAAMGVAHLAKNGLVQNDIKPGNILLFGPEPGSGENGRAVLSDFGGALAIGDDRLGEGTVGFRPPEARRRVECHPSAEVFSMAHTCLMTLSKRQWTESNMFASEAVMTEADKDCLDMIEDISKFHEYRSDPVLRPTLDELVASLTSMSGRLLAKERAVATAGIASDVEALPLQVTPLTHGSGGGGDVAVLSTDSGWDIDVSGADGVGAGDGVGGVFGADSGGVDDASILGSGVGGGGMIGSENGRSNVCGGNVVDSCSGGGGIAGRGGGSNADVLGVNAGGGGVAGQEGGSGGGGSVVAVFVGNAGGGSVGGDGGRGGFDTGRGGGGSGTPSVPRQASGGDEAARPAAAERDGGATAVGTAAGGPPILPMPRDYVGAVEAAAAEAHRHHHNYQRNGRRKSRGAPKPTRAEAAAPRYHHHHHHHRGDAHQGVGIGVRPAGHRQGARLRGSGGSGDLGRRAQHSGFRPSSRKNTVHQRQGRKLAPPPQRSGVPHVGMGGGNRTRGAHFACPPV